MKNIPCRGIRNNNPFNIKRSYIEWIGEDNNPDVFDPTFEQFTNMRFGIRAGIKLLVNYIKNGYDTPRKIISRFAPSVENNTDSYISFVCRHPLGFVVLQSDAPLVNVSSFCFLCSRMVTLECNLNRNQLINFHLEPRDFGNWYHQFISNSPLLDDYE